MILAVCDVGNKLPNYTVKQKGREEREQDEWHLQVGMGEEMERASLCRQKTRNYGGGRHRSGSRAPSYTEESKVKLPSIM